ncbi:heterogeneous nuclear ribonucleoprotein R-like [Contarinia nasturtii]|uniref:heterogeneous nuclear ribonucleoprotein R-like n=1 Tax=Contarinia nasturtii TaxID=265458 RepID=UPI0012D3B10D|nr:heterogeneous nuclear ribonucleoprotein R-like [Contarinia nasturtii]XP_031635776.1 heterogeneous nuclear ribonucleoprotein R-like [Contarinia nasturtii]
MSYRFFRPELHSKSFDLFRQPCKKYSRILPNASWATVPMPIRTPPNEDELKAHFVSFGYSVDITTKYRRIFTDEEQPSSGEGVKSDSSSESNAPLQLYCGHIPSDVTERELFDVINGHAKPIEICLMMDAVTQKHRGFAFIKLANEQDQQLILSKINGFEIRPSRYLKLNIYKPNRSLYVANIPKSISADQLREEFDKILQGIANVVVYRPFSNCRIGDQNRGFCFLEFESHEMARVAKRKLEQDPKRIFTNAVFVDWADSLDPPSDEVMQNVRVLYVRNIHETVTESQLEQVFSPFGEIQRVKRIKNFAFIHFLNRCDALNAMKSLQNLQLCGENISISLSYPPLDKKKKEEVLRLRQERIMRETPIRIRY